MKPDRIICYIFLSAPLDLLVHSVQQDTYYFDFADRQKVCTVQTSYQGHPTPIFGKYLFGRRLAIQNFRNICCKISCLPASPRIFEYLKNGMIVNFNGFLPLRGHLEFSGVFFLTEIFQKVNLIPYNFRITRLSARKSEQMKNFQEIKVCLYVPFKY